MNMGKKTHSEFRVAWEELIENMRQASMLDQGPIGIDAMKRKYLSKISESLRVAIMGKRTIYMDLSKLRESVRLGKKTQMQLVGNLARVETSRRPRNSCILSRMQRVEQGPERVQNHARSDGRRETRKLLGNPVNGHLLQLHRRLSKVVGELISLMIPLILL